MPNKIVVKSTLTIHAPAAQVWEFLSDPGRFARLFSPSADVEFSEERLGFSGALSLNGLNFRLRMAPYDVLLSAPACTIVLRLTDQRDGRCFAEMASSSLDTAGFLVRERDLYNTLCRLRSVVCGPEADDSDDLFDEDEPARQEKAVPAKRSRAAKRVLAAAAVVALLCAAGIFVLPRLTERTTDDGAQTAVDTGDLSALVTFQNAQSISLGADRREVELLFGTEGMQSNDGSEALYRSDVRNGAGQPAEQVCVRYSGSKVQSVTYLNLKNATRVGGVSDLFPEVTATDFDAILEQVGLPLSMFRRVADEEGERLELHFGYLDPFANFNPAWRGELEVDVRLADGSLTVGRRTGYDGSDPLLVASLENTPLANQFDTYTDYLQDKYQYDRALLLRGQYSRGDAAAIFGALTEYDAGYGAVAYAAAPPETLPDGTPVYRYSFGFENSGKFNMAAFVNMRLMNRPGMLEGTRWRAVTRNMSYGEVRALTGILPTSVYVNNSFLFLGYGRYVGGTEPELQFEFTVRLRLDDLYVDSVYDNTGVSSPV